MNKDRFCQLWERCGGTSDAAGAIFVQLAEHYQTPGRYYHTGEHIDHCLTQMDKAIPVLGQSDGVELAIWFHDVIYDPPASDNEQLSADWFAEKAAGVISPELIRQVVDDIMSTIHCDTPTAASAKFVVDVDLSGLGMPEKSFRYDGDNIRKESAHLEDAEFGRRQSAFLQKLLERERIYYTDFFHDLYEAPARENIQHAIGRYAKLQE